MIAKAVLGLTEVLGPEPGAVAAVRAGVDFGVATARRVGAPG